MFCFSYLYPFCPKSLKLKYDTISKALKEEQEDIMTTSDAFDLLLELAEDSLNKYKSYTKNEDKAEELTRAEDYLSATQKIEKILNEKADHNKNQQAYLEKIGLEISRMKNGSIALVNQITTVSKMRIFDPRNLKGVLSGISLSEENMEKINEKVKELYVFQ